MGYRKPTFYGYSHNYILWRVGMRYVFDEQHLSRKANTYRQPCPCRVSVLNEDMGYHDEVYGRAVPANLAGRLEHPDWSPIKDPESNGTRPFEIHDIRFILDKRRIPYQLTEFNGMEHPGVATYTKTGESGPVNIRDLITWNHPDWCSDYRPEEHRANDGHRPEPILHLHLVERRAPHFQPVIFLKFTKTTVPIDLWRPRGNQHGFEFFNLETLRVAKPKCGATQTIQLSNEMWHGVGRPDFQTTGWLWTEESHRVALEAWDSIIGPDWTEYKAPGT